MNQSCRVCGEVAAGYHFGAFTCEGCKSFFGRTYNNRSSIGECKNQGQCIINKKNRTSCKSCRLKKCFAVGMSKSGSRYGRRSNWFKIHCLLQDQGMMQQQQQQQEAAAAAAAQPAQPQPPVPHQHPNQLPQTPLPPQAAQQQPAQHQQQLLLQQQLQQQHQQLEQQLQHQLQQQQLEQQLQQQLQQQQLSIAALAAASGAAGAGQQQQNNSFNNINNTCNSNQRSSSANGTGSADPDAAQQMYASALAQIMAYFYVASQRQQP